MGEIGQWVSASLSSTHALVVALIAALTGAWRAMRLVLVAAALSSVREETITELRREIDHLRAEVEYYRTQSHSRGGNGGSGSTTRSSASNGNGTTTSK